MSMIRKLNTLFRASAREAVEHVVDANEVRIYEQEIIDAEASLGQRRSLMAEMIGNRKELEAEIRRVRESMARREEELARLPASECTEALLELAAEEIAASETQLEQLQGEQQRLHLAVQELEITLRGLMREIRQHRRDLKALRSQSQLVCRTGAATGAANTLNGRLQALRQTRSRISERASGCEQLEAGVAEMSERLDGDPLQRALDSSGASEQAAHVGRVLARLKGQMAPGSE